jgi:hypothetical protein
MRKEGLAELVWATPEHQKWSCVLCCGAGYLRLSEQACPQVRDLNLAKRGCGK